MKQEKIAIYPGTFDPVTLGHMDILNRALRLFDKVIVAVAANPGKNPMFDFETRTRLMQENVRGIPRVSVAAMSGLTVDLARTSGAIALIRGLRAVSDFEFEFQLAQMNRHLDADIETIFLMPSPKYFYTSSTIIRQVCEYSPDRVKKFIPDNVLELMLSRGIIKK